MMKRLWRYGCLLCRTGAEAAIAGYVNQRIECVETVAPPRIRRKTVAGKAIEDRSQLLPGYIFFRTDTDAPFHRLTYIANVLKLLEYEPLSWELTGGATEFWYLCKKTRRACKAGRRVFEFPGQTSAGGLVGLGGKIQEFGEFAHPAQLYRAQGAVSLFGDDELGDVLVWSVGVEIFLSV